MRAVVITHPGGPEVLAVAEVPDLPAPGQGEVLVTVAAAGVNRADLLQREGHYSPPPGASELLGLECSGTVAALGAGVEGWQVDQEVCALLAGGGYAEQVLVPAGQLLPVPAGVELVTAAALPEVAATVWSNVVDVAPGAALQQQELLLVHGGSSGIGTHAIQVAAHVIGARVAVTAGSAAKLARCAELGAEVLIDYHEQDFVAEVRAATGGRGADAILDGIGAKYLARNVDALAPDGRLVVIGFQGGATAELNMAVLLVKRARLSAASLRGRSTEDKARVVAGTLRDTWPAIADGRVRPVVDRVLPLDRAGEAHQLLTDSTHIGKVLLAL